MSYQRITEDDYPECPSKMPCFAKSNQKDPKVWKCTALTSVYPEGECPFQKKSKDGKPDDFRVLKAYMRIKRKMKFGTFDPHAMGEQGLYDMFDAMTQKHRRAYLRNKKLI